MKDILQNLLMTLGLLPVSMLLVGIYMKLFGPYEKKFYWGVVVGLYGVMLFVCWGVETGLLYQMVNR